MQVYEDLSSLPATASSQQLQSGIVIVDNDDRRYRRAGWRRRQKARAA
ncbi:MAG: hypothetical protein ACLU3I_15850 [Acutalibacteraceae bacterium]